jgi:acyl-CoA thioesterase-1
MRIVIFGDSISQGFHDTEMGGWANRLFTELMRREVESGHTYNISGVNLGISGDTTEDVLNRIRTESEARLCKYPTDTFDVLLLAIGVNDSQFAMDTGEHKIQVEETVKNIENIISETADLYGRVVLVGIAPVFDERIQPMAWKPTHGYSNAAIVTYNEAIRAFAEKHNLLFIDMDGVYDDPGACLPDGIHPNAAGHQMMFERIKTELEAVKLI